MAKTERFTFWIKKENKTRLEQASKITHGNSMGKLLNCLIEQKLADPIKVLKKERDQLVEKINIIHKKINDLEQ